MASTKRMTCRQRAFSRAAAGAIPALSAGLLAVVVAAGCAGGGEQVRADAPPIKVAPVKEVALLVVPRGEVTSAQASLVRDQVARALRRRYRLQVLAGEAFEQALWAGGAARGAPPSAREFRKLVGRARKQVERLQLGKAIGSLEKARELLPECGPWLGSEELAELFLVAGRLQASAENRDAALAHFRKALEMNPGLDPGGFRLDAGQLELFEQARRQVTSGKPHQVEITSQPPECRIFVDGTARGTTPGKVELYSGQHFVRLEQDGYLPWTRALPDGVPPAKLEVRLYRVWTGTALDRLAGELFADEPDSEALEEMGRLAGFYKVGAVVLIALETDDGMLQSSSRLYFAKENVFTRPFFINLGKSPAGWKVTARNLVGFFKELKKPRRTSKGKKRRRGKRKNR